MSTKTTLKRFALVAVSAMGFGLLSAVAPAQAAGSLTAVVLPTAEDGEATDIGTEGLTEASAFRLGQEDIAIVVQRNGVLAAQGVKLVFTSSPDASATVGTPITATAAGVVDVTSFSTLDFTDEDATNGNTGGMYTAFELDAAGFNTAGDYAATAWVDADADNVVDATEIQAAVSFTIGGAPDSATVSFSPNPVFADAGDNTVTAVFTFYDEDDNLTALDALDDFEWTATDAFGDEADIADTTDLTRLANGSYTSGSVLSPGTAGAYTTITLDIELLGQNGDEVEVFATGAITIRTRATDASAITLTTTTGIDFGATAADDGILNAGDTAEAIGLDPAVVTSLSFKVAGDAGDYISIAVAKPAADAATNVATATTVVRIGSDGLAYLNVPASGGVDGKSFTVTVDAAADFIYTFTYADAEPVLSVDVEGSYKSAISTAQSFKVRIRDQYAIALTGTRVTATVTGRNPAVFSGLADASGYVNFSWTDAGAAVGATTATSTDTVTFSATDATSIARTVTYSTSGPAVATVTITDDETDNAHDIDPSEAIAGLPAGYVTYTVRVLDATGAPISGVRVSMAGSADDLFYLGDSVGITAAGTGETTINAYRRVAGYANLSATAGSVVASDLTPVLWSAVSSGARSVEISTSNATAIAQGIIRVTATVKDRWGNAVPLANVTLTENGAGRLYSGETASKTTTLGVATWDLTSLAGETGTNSLTVTVTAVDVNDNGAVAAAEGLAQMDDLAGFIGTTAVAGLAAGVRQATASVTFTVDTSVSTADALLELAKAIGTGKSVEEAADAAAEAIDAANAATDASNLAAEAADAATVAAEEARDAADAATAAVEELATQVATLMSALKAQLTTLANTVAKIAKKVKA